MPPKEEVAEQEPVITEQETEIENKEGEDINE